jgi:galactoside O-acetyltransferase
VVLDDLCRIEDFVVMISSGEVCEFGKHAHIASHCVFLGRAGFTLSDFSSLSPGVKIITLSDDYSGAKLTNSTVPKEFTGGPMGRVRLGRHAIIGSGSVILPGVEIGEGSSVGAMSLVWSNLPAWGVYFGVPVRRFSERKRNLLVLEQQLLEAERRAEDAQNGRV